MEEIIYFYTLIWLIMKNLFTLLIVSFLFTASYAQISIDKNDMATPNDTFRISSAANVSSFNFINTGTNYSWDFSGLTSKGQTLEHYVAISATPAIYNVVFMYPFIATFAQVRPDAQIATISITDGYNFYKNTTSSLKEVGFGAKVQGAPIPVQYQSADVIYKFPMNYNNLDSSDSYWQLSIPSLGFISEKKHRVNQVDGWGSVTTPYGTFNCLRLKSTVYQVDSFHYDSIPLPFPAIPQTYTEYIWLAKNTGFPVVKATVRGMATTVSYIDSIKSFVGINPPKAEESFSFYPNPTNEIINIAINSTSEKSFNLRIFNVVGELVLEESLSGQKNQTLNVAHLKKGVYFVTVKLTDRTISKRLIIN